MSEWNSNDRRPSTRGRTDEGRSFGQSGGADWSRREFQNPGSAGQGGVHLGQGYGGQGSGGGETGQSYGGREGYGGQQGYRPQGTSNYGHDQSRRPASGSPDYGRQGYGQDYGRQDFGQEQNRRQDFGDPNDQVRRVADGEADHGGFLGLGGGHGPHRGRGPKNYTRSDDRIREDVNDRLADDPMLDATEIDVQVTSCEVSLTGTVDSREDKRRAEDIVERVSGVKHVQNNLRVQPRPQTGAGQTATSGF